LYFDIELPRTDSSRSGSAGFGFNQIGSLRFRCSGFIDVMPFKAADPRILLFDRAMFDVEASFY